MGLRWWPLRFAAWPAAKEIKTLIGARVMRVELGTTLVGEAGTTMREVVNSIRPVTDILGEISAASSLKSQAQELVQTVAVFEDRVD